ncbi:hypothetical protein [Arthrobacter sp. HS15c]|uniref:hypothetical protein n=1 Tax=Arthrobacter sp. HS15c TaxID=3230279 RepID=UPI003467B19C
MLDGGLAVEGAAGVGEFQVQGAPVIFAGLAGNESGLVLADDERHCTDGADGCHPHDPGHDFEKTARTSITLNHNTEMFHRKAETARPAGSRHHSQKQ